jgi:phosphate-selective porin OprO/OprP
MDNRVLLKKTDKLMVLAHLPLTYVQEHVPFLTRRNIIFFGRIELDYSHYSSGVLADESGLAIRRFRLGLAGHVKFWPGWNYKVEIDLVDSQNNLSDAYLSWHFEKLGTFRIGNQQVAQTLSGQTSSISIPFMERPLPVLAFTLQRRLGLGYNVHGKRLGADATVFGKDQNEDIGSHGWATRFYFNPTRSNTHVLHIGGSYMQLFTNADARLRARPESNKTDIRLVDTRVFTDVDKATSFGLELAASVGPATLRSEFYRAEWIQKNAGNPKFDGWYVELSSFLTGEKAHYREGKFIRPNIISTRGAWEIAARFSTVDLNDKGVKGGQETNLSFGLNWYSKINWRFMGNLIKVSSDGPNGEQNPWILQFRAQYYF